MPDPINLRQARKAKKRATQETIAAQNRITFGQSKASLVQAKAQTSLDQRRLDGLVLVKDKTS